MLRHLICLLKAGGVKCAVLCSCWRDLELKLAKFITVTAQFFFCQMFHWIHSQRTTSKFGSASRVITQGTPVFRLKVRVDQRPTKVKDYLITSWFANSILSPVQNIKIHNLCSPWSLSRVLNIISPTKVLMCFHLLMQYLVALPWQT